MKVPPLANDLAAYQFDAAVAFVGLVIENALQEREKVVTSKGTDYRAQYDLTQLLEPSFRLPLPAQRDKAAGGPLESFVAQVKAMAGPINPGIRFWQYVPPEAEKAA